MFGLGQQRQNKHSRLLFFFLNPTPVDNSLKCSPFIDDTHRTKEPCSPVGCFTPICAWTQLPDLDIRCPLRSPIFYSSHVCLPTPRFTLLVSLKTISNRKPSDKFPNCLSQAELSLALFGWTLRPTETAEHTRRLCPFSFFPLK